MRVYLSENAFLALLLSSAEVFSRECLGLLLGYRLEDRFIVEHVVSLQTADRGHRGVIYHDKNHRKIEPILDRYDRLRIIGDFHSHTQFRETKGLAIPSSEDIKGMKPAQVHIIIAVNNIQKALPWRENRDGTVSGSAGKLFFKISAHFLNGTSGVKRARIHCPFPPGF
jgi:proteasome lid subunit RPN8/RPN11